VSMPFYTFECLYCSEQTEAMLEMHDLDGLDPYEMDLKELGVVCENCGKFVFKKIVTPHGKTIYNWGKWARRG